MTERILGVSYLAWSYGEIFMECYADASPVEDALHVICNNACAVSDYLVTHVPDLLTHK